MATIEGQRPSTFIEVPPGKTLEGLADTHIAQVDTTVAMVHALQTKKSRISTQMLDGIEGAITGKYQ